jgi:hypothetical protein
VAPVQSETFPNRSDFENGWYGISWNWAGIDEGPHPEGLSDITGGSNLAAILDLFTLKTHNMIF